MIKKLLIGVTMAGLSALAAGGALADECYADAQFVHSMPLDGGTSKFMFKFRVSSDDCQEYSCRGYINFRIHFDYDSGTSSGDNTLMSYTIRRGQRTAEVSMEHYPANAGSKLTIRDIEVGEVSCSTP